MYWGESNIYVAKSENLIDWTPVEVEKTSRNNMEGLLYVARPRKGRFDSVLIEPGPPAILSNEGIMLIYNSKNDGASGDKNLPNGTYSAGVMVFDRNDPTALVSRTQNYFFAPDRPYEITGQVNNVCFLEGLVKFKGEWLLYYGTADSKIAVASCITAWE